MRAGGGKSKGSAFERLVCERLSRWMSRGLRDDLLWRSAMSGGRATVKAKKGMRNVSQVGDISAIDPQGEHLTGTFCIECKTYKDLHLDQLYVTTQYSTDGLSKFWRKHCAVSLRANRLPMLVAKQNTFAPGPMVCLDDRGIKALRLGREADPESFLQLYLAHYPLHNLYVFTLNTFVQYAYRPYIPTPPVLYTQT
jgi:hypothetical protein